MQNTHNVCDYRVNRNFPEAVRLSVNYNQLAILVIFAL
jgi:hypothetical protein